MAQCSQNTECMVAGIRQRKIKSNSGNYHSCPLGLLEPVEENASHNCPVVPAPYIAPHHEIMCRERRAKSVSSVDPAKPNVCWCGSRPGCAKRSGDGAPVGIGTGAEVGCSRPIAEGENWMERERYIGVSGVLLKSDLYLTLGISGTNSAYGRR